MSAPVGYLLKKFPRLSETFILNEILGLERLGWGIHVFSRRSAEAGPRHPQLGSLRAEVVDLQEIDPWPALLAGAESSALLRGVGALHAEAAGWAHPRFPSLIGEALHLLPLLESRSIRHVHAHFATDSAVVAALVRKLGGPTYSVTLHAKDIYRDGVSSERLERIVSGAELAITVCDANVRHLERLLSARATAKVRRLYNGIDLERFDGSPAGAARDSDHVLAVGRLVEKKGFDVLLRAIVALARRGRGAVRVTIVGDGDQRPHLEQAIRELGLGERVSLAGALDQDAVRDLMARATLLCVPCIVGSDGNQDALPTVLLEAMASGLPVVTTPIGGIPEIVDEGRAGVLVAPGDAEAAAAAIEELLRDPDRRRALADAARRRAERLFDLRASARTLSGWLHAIVEGRAPDIARSADEPERPGAAAAPALGPDSSGTAAALGGPWASRS